MDQNLKNQDNSFVKKNKKKSILFVIGGLGVGGKERQLVELIHGLPGEKYELHLLVKDCEAYYLDKIMAKLSTFHTLDQKHFRLFDFKTFAKHISMTKPDIVCSWTNITSHFCLLAKLFTSHPYRIVNCCIRNAPLELTLVLQFERFIYSFYNTVVANSQAGLVAYGQQNREGRFVLYNGFDFSRMEGKNKQPTDLNFVLAGENAFNVVMVASLTDLKDHETYLRAAKICMQKTPDIHFYVVGDGPKRDGLEKMAQDLGLSSNLAFLGGRDDVENIFMGADLSVLTSTSWFGEGISNSILESMACGTPVVATKSPGTSEVIEDGVNGFIVPCGDHQSLALKIQELTMQPELLQVVSTRAKATVREKFSIDQLITTFMNIMESC